MSTTIDERVVQMRFDNKQFEANVKTTMSTLEKLKQSLNLSGAAKGFENINSAAKNFTMSGVSSAVDTVQNKFSAFEVMAVTALANITNSAVNAGKRIVSALTIDPIKTGFSEYETQINAVQTILANTSSKGTTLDQVNKALDELNAYADKTIYNFTQMTKNIGTFTAAGVDLDTSVSAIQGIANLAAVSGSTSQQASTAMYQLSQAIAAGRVSLQDWNSVVNAGMGGEVFQNALKRTAKAMGIVVDETMSFRESISTAGGKESWLTSDVLLQTLSQFTMAAEEGTAEWEEYKKSLKEKGFTEAQAKEILKMANTAQSAATDVKTLSQLWDTLKESAQSGWTQSWEIIFGDFDESKVLFSDLYKTFSGIIDKSSKARNELLAGALNGDQIISAEDWSQFGIDDTVFQNALKKTARMQGVAIDAMIEKEGSFIATLKEGWLTLDILKETFKNYEEMKAVGYTDEQIAGLKKIIDTADDAGSALNSLVEVASKPGGRQLLIESLRNGIDSLISIVNTAKEAWGEIFPPVTSERIYNIIKKVHDLSESLKPTNEMSNRLKRSFKGLFTTLEVGVKIFSTLAGVGTTIAKKVFKTLGNAVLDFTGYIGDNSEKIEKFTDKVITEALTQLNELYEYIKNSKFVKDFATNMGSAFTFLREVLKQISKEIPNLNFGTLTDNFKALQRYGVEAVEKVSKAFNKFVKFLSQNKYAGTIIEKIGSAFEYLRTKVNGLKTLTVEDFLACFDDLYTYLKNGNYLTTGIDMIVGSIRYFKDALYEKIGPMSDTVLGKISTWASNRLKDIEKIIDALGDIPAVAKNAGEALGNALSNLWNLDEIIDVGKSMTTILVLYQLYRTLKNFADLPKSISKVFLEISDTFKAMQNRINASAFMELSKAVAIIAASIFVLAQLDWNEAWKAAVAVGGIIVVLAGIQAGLTALNNKFGEFKMAGFSLSVVALAAGVLLLAKAFKDLEGVKWKESVDGLKIMMSMLSGLVAGGSILNKIGGKFGASSITLLALVFALDKLIGVLQKYANLKWEDMLDGAKILGAVGTGLAVFLGVIGSFTKGSNLWGAAATIVALTAALYYLKDIIQVYADIDWSKSGKGVAAIVTIAVALSFFCATISGCINGLDGLGTAAIIIGLGLALKVLVDALTMFSDMSVGQVIGGIASLAALGAGIAAFIAVVSKFDGKAVKNIAALALGVLAVVAAVAIFGNMQWDKLLRGVGSIAFLLVTLGASLELAGKFDKSAIGGVVAMATAIAVMTASIYFLKDIPWNQLLASAGSLALLMVALGGAMRLVGNTSLSTGGGLLAAAVGITAIAGALYLLKDIPWEQLKYGLTTIAISLGVVIVALKMCKGAVEGATALAIALLSFGGTVALVGAAVLMITAGIAIVAEVLPEISEGLSQLITTLAGCKDYMGDFSLVFIQFSTTFLAAGGFISSGITLIAIGFVAAAVGIIALSAALIPFALALSTVAISAAGVAISFGMFAGAVALMGKALTLSEAGISALGRGIKQLVTDVASCKDSIGAFSLVMLNIGGTITLTLISISAGLTALAGAITVVGIACIPFSAGLAVAGVGLSVLSLGVLAFNAALIATGAAMTSISSGLTNLGSGFQNTAKGLDSLITSISKLDADTVSFLGIVELTAALAALSIPIENMAVPMAAVAAGFTVFSVESATTAVSLGVLTEEIKVLMTEIKGIASIVANASSSLTKNMLDIGNKLLEIVSATKTSTADVINGIVDNIVKALGNNHNAFTVEGRMLVVKFVRGIEERKGLVMSTTTAMVNSSVNAIRQKQNDYKSAGAYLVTGFVNGIRSNTNKASQAAASMAKSASSAAKNELKIKSPSRVFFEIGDFAGQGFVNALSIYDEKSYKVASLMGASAKEGLTNAISKVMDAINGDMDVQPTIRPVIDLTDVRNATGQIDGMLNANRSLSLGAEISNARLNAVSDTTALEDILSNIGDNGDVVSAISLLRGDISTLGELMSNLKVVMNSGALVGEIISDVDKAAGVRAIRNRRERV